MGCPILEVIDTSGLKGPAYLLSHLILGDALVLQAECNVLLDSQGEDLVVRILEDEAHMLCQLVGWMLSDVEASNCDLAFHIAVVEMGDETVESPTEGGLSASAWPS